MQRTQIYLTDEERALLGQRADDQGMSLAAVIRALLDRALGLGDQADALAGVVDDTAGMLSGYPDWPEWLEGVRGGSASDRLGSLGL